MNHQSERDKAAQMMKAFAEERKQLLAAEKHKRNPYKGTNYPKNYQPVIKVPLPKIIKSIEEKTKEAIRKVPQVVTTQEESCFARYK